MGAEHVLTERLDLRRPDPVGDLAALFAIFSDPESWWYEPAGRHGHSGHTHDWLTRAASRFGADGLSYWTVRLRDDDTIIGVGGAQRQRTGAWNLNYRIHKDHQSQGLATELPRTALTLAAELDGTVPVIAWIAEHNIPSRRVAENVGLVNYGLATDPSDQAQRLAYADRRVDGFTGSA